jgi:hypothetical protein
VEGRDEVWGREEGEEREGEGRRRKGEAAVHDFIFAPSFAARITETTHRLIITWWSRHNRTRTVGNLDTAWNNISNAPSLMQMHSAILLTGE